MTHSCVTLLSSNMHVLFPKSISVCIASDRLSAVFGGTFCLRRSAVYLIINKQSGKCSGIIDNTGSNHNVALIVSAYSVLYFKHKYTAPLGA